jgi:DNA-binding transcriptional LysR family regulator
MELRNLRAFVAAAQDLHFARAAGRLNMSPASMTDLIRKLEAELGTPLFTRTTRRVVLTDAGRELLGRAETILELVAQAATAVDAVARGDGGTVRLGITPLAGPVIAPHLARRFTDSRAGLSVDIQRMWLPALGAALVAGTIDVALTCGALGTAIPRVTTIEIGSEQLLIGLRPGHPLAAEATVDPRQLAEMTLGLHPVHLFPAWHAAQRRILSAVGITPPIVELEDADLTARRWTHQGHVDWVMLISSLLPGHEGTVVRPAPGHTVPFTLSWSTEPVVRPVVQRFIDSSLAVRPPDGWIPSRLPTATPPLG